MSVFKGTIQQPPNITTSTTKEQGGSTSFSSLHSDIIGSHILPKLDGATLSSASYSSSSFYHLCSQDYLWFQACSATWPSTTSPLLREILAKFTNGGPRAFFAQSYPLPHYEHISTTRKFSLYDYEKTTYNKTSLILSNFNRLLTPLPPKLISAVDIHYEEKLIFSKVQETETETGWFRCSPFRIDLLEPKDVVTTPVRHPESDDSCNSLMEDMSLSWILIDPIQRTAVNLSSHKPILVNRHWLTGEVQMKFVTIHEGPTSVYVQCKVVVTCAAGSEAGEMQVREVCLEVEDMEGAHMFGKESLVIFQRALKGKRRKGNLRAKEARKKYKEFLEMKELRKQKKFKREEALDVLCVSFGISIFVVFLWFILYGEFGLICWLELIFLR